MPKKPSAEKRRRGGQPIVLDEGIVEELAAQGLPVTEIAALMHCSHDVIDRRYHGSLERGWDARNGRLRQEQFEVAMSGNPTMLIWLGKQYLGQSDRPAPDNGGSKMDELIAAIKASGKPKPPDTEAVQTTP